MAAAQPGEKRLATLEERVLAAQRSSPAALAQRVTMAKDAGQKYASAQVAGGFALRRFVDNLLNIPGGVGEALAIGAAVPQTVVGAAGAKLQGQPMEVMRRFGEARSEQRQQLPASALLAAGERMPGAPDVAAGIDVLSDLPGALTRPLPETWKPGDPLLGPAMDEARARDVERTGQLREQHPVAAPVGEAAGDLATLLLGRAPFAGRIRDFTNPPRRVPKVTSGPRAEADKFLSQPWVQQTERGLRKAGEAGIEAAALSLVAEGDPVTSAFLAAGGQASGSAAMWLTSKYVKHLTPALVGTMFAVHLFNSAVPGGERNIFEALDTSTNKALAAMGAGFFAAVLGAGRLPKSTQENLGFIGEAIGPALRTPMLTLIRAFTEERERGDDTTLRVMDRLAVDPDAFGEKARKQIEKTIEAGGDLSERIGQLMETREFRRAYEDLEPEATDAP